MLGGTTIPREITSLLNVCFFALLYLLLAWVAGTRHGRTLWGKLLAVASGLLGLYELIRATQLLPHFGMLLGEQGTFVQLLLSLRIRLPGVALYFWAALTGMLLFALISVPCTKDDKARLEGCGRTHTRGLILPIALLLLTMSACVVSRLVGLWHYLWVLMYLTTMCVVLVRHRRTFWGKLVAIASGIDGLLLLILPIEWKLRGAEVADASVTRGLLYVFGPYLVGLLLLGAMSIPSYESRCEQSAHTDTDAQPGKRRNVVLTIVFLLVTMNIYWVFWLYRTVREIRRFAPEVLRVRPWQAVLFLFVPLFNLFWMPYVLAVITRSVGRLNESCAASLNGSRYASWAVLLFAYYSLVLAVWLPFAVDDEALHLYANRYYGDIGGLTLLVAGADGDVEVSQYRHFVEEAREMLRPADVFLHCVVLNRVLILSSLLAITFFAYTQHYLNGIWGEVCHRSSS